MTALPKEINYSSSRFGELPTNCSSLSAVSVPSNGSSFAPSSIIQVDLNSRGFLVPSSLYIRYKVTLANAAAAGSMRGCPVYTPIQRLETLISSSTVESISNYNQLMAALVDLKMTNSQKAGFSQAFGYGGVSTAFTNDNVQGRVLQASGVASAENFTVSAPLNCILANCDTLYPLKYSGGVRLQFTLDTLANMFNATGIPTAFTISNFEVCYDVIDFDASTESQIMSMSDNGKIKIKSQSYLSQGQTLAAASAGTLEFIYNMRLASIKSLFLLPAGTAAAVSINQFLDFVDATSIGLQTGNNAGAGNGSYQFLIASQTYPQRELSTLLNKNGIMSELSAALGPAHDLLTTNFGITPVNFNSNNITVTTAIAPGRFIVGVNTERISTNSAFMSGVSSQFSPISVRINFGSAVTNAMTLQLVALFDAVIELDMMNKQVVVFQ